MDVAYGIQIAENNDPYIEIAESAISSLGLASVPGTLPADLFPILKYIPSWLPGAGYKSGTPQPPLCHQTLECYQRQTGIVVAYTSGRRTLIIWLGKGEASESIAETLIESLTEGDDEEVARNTAAACYADRIWDLAECSANLGGNDTTICTLRVFMLAMVLHPEVQRKAQEELDAVIGDRLPTFEDREQLPYVRALMKEVTRWQSVTPMGFAHRVTEDDVYDGYFIPKVYAERRRGLSRSRKFNPDRFLKDGEIDPNVLDPGQAAFGFGRRYAYYTSSDLTAAHTGS
ncbi:cytochrome P450 [Salix suchowensis]|nr:cytochrome P450 [Salix suchowensis]